MMGDGTSLSSVWDNLGWILQDADSLDERSGKKKEGEFYVWEKAEIDSLLGGQDSDQASTFAAFYNVKADGNTTLSKNEVLPPSMHRLRASETVGLVYGRAEIYILL